MWENRGGYSPGNDTSFYNANILAVECGLWLCMQAQSVNVFRDVLNDTIVSRYNGIGDREVDGDFPKPPASFNVQNATTYGLGLRVGDGLHTTLIGLLSGKMTINGSFDVSYSGGDIAAELTGNLPRSIGTAADCLHAAWVYADDLDAWWTRLTKSPTNNIRPNGVIVNVNDGRYAGTAWTDVVFICVRWLWLIFPASLVLLFCISLVATIWASSIRGLKAWKTWMLPVLYTRLEEGLQEEWRQEYAGAESLLEVVEQRWVGLNDSRDDGWVFRHVVKGSTKQDI